MWSKLIDWYMYMRLQSNYPEPGNTCLLGNLTCLVVSNQYGNRVVVLQVQDADWQGAYIMLTGSNLKAWQWLPTLVMGIIDDPQDGQLTRGYVLKRSEMGERQNARGKRTLPATSIYTSMMQFDELARKFKNKWFQGQVLTTPDWRFKASHIRRSAKRIQSRWRMCIASPCYTMCIKRLLREYHALNPTGLSSAAVSPHTHGW
jgi:hypothetical protein